MRSRTTTGLGGARSREWLVGAQVALTFVLTVAAALLLRSFERLQGTDLGFRRHDVLSAEVRVPAGRFSAERPWYQRIQYFDQLIADLERLPGVRSVGGTSNVPLTGEVGSGSMWRTDAESGATGIDKRPVDGPVLLDRLGVAGDHVMNTAVHGGADQAVYAYSAEDAAWWADSLSRAITPGNFGENLTTTGISLGDAVIGERWSVGTDALLEVSRPRIPCSVFAGFWDVPDLIKRFTVRAHPGCYLRVIAPGPVRAGDPITVVSRPSHGVTIEVVFRALTLSPELLPRVLDAPELPQQLRDRVARRLATP